MKFNEIMDEIYDRTEQETNTAHADHNILSPDGLITTAKLWNMIAILFPEKGLDDFIVIGNNNSIISKPLKPVKEKSDENSNTPQDGKSQKSKTAKNKKLDVKEEDKTDSESATSAE